eukprot:UN05486
MCEATLIIYGYIRQQEIAMKITIPSVLNNLLLRFYCDMFQFDRHTAYPNIVFLNDHKITKTKSNCNSKCQYQTCLFGPKLIGKIMKKLIVTFNVHQTGFVRNGFCVFHTKHVFRQYLGCLTLTIILIHAQLDMYIVILAMYIRKLEYSKHMLENFLHMMNMYQEVNWVREINRKIKKNGHNLWFYLSILKIVYLQYLEIVWKRMHHKLLVIQLLLDGM